MSDMPPNRSLWRSDAALLALLLVELTLVRLAIAALTPLSPDEAYYWIWSRALQTGYLDHPPMVAVWIKIGTMLLGRTTLGVRLLAPLSALAGSVLIYRAGEALFPNKRAGLIAALMLNATLFLGAGSVIITPDTPLMLFWCLCLFCLAQISIGRPAWWWYWAGLSAGLAMDSKYTAALLPLAVGCLMLGSSDWRKWFLKKEPYIAVIIAIWSFIPVLLWNHAHQWASFGRQGGRVADFHPERAWRYLSELVLGQIGLATPIIFLAAVGGVWFAVRHRRQAVFALLAAITIIPTLVFVQHAFGDRVQANWPCILYPGACLAAAGAGFQRWRSASILGFVLTAIVYLQAAFSPFPLRRQLDPSLVQLGGWREWAMQANQMRISKKLDFLASENYGEASLLAWYLPGTDVIAAQPRWDLFHYPKPDFLVGHRGLLVTSPRSAKDQAEDPYWAAAAPLGQIARSRNGMVASMSDLYQIRANSHAGMALLEMGR